MTRKTKWVIANSVALAVLVLVLYYGARHWNPTRPYVGEPTARHFEFFARRFNNTLVQMHVPVNDYSADLRRTDSLTHPLLGEFNALVNGTPRHYQFAWDGRWVFVGDKDSLEARATDEAQK